MTNRHGIAMLALAVMLGAMTLSGPASAQPKAALAATPAAGGQMGREPHPQIRLALRSLEDARMRLERGARDFGGHRAKALALTDRATEQLHKALHYDRR